MMNRGVAIVTGSRRGIGKSIALNLAKAGFDVVVSDIENDEHAETTMSEIRQLGRACRFQACDVGDEGSHAALLAASEELGELTCLVNNAGVSSTVRGDMLDLPVESLDRALRVNLRGPFLLSQTFAKRLIAHGGSKGFRSIVNITSVNATILGLNRPDYCITKAALSTVTRLFAARLADEGIHVYEVRPGMTLTEMTAPSRSRYDTMIAEGEVPMKRWGVPDDIGAAVTILASGGFQFSTGDAIHVDGGLSLHRV
jgi:NAD(P)-dependent dehydrogenase (short-subunit alcohol dehydrogenase family)